MRIELADLCYRHIGRRARYISRGVVIEGEISDFHFVRETVKNVTDDYDRWEFTGMEVTIGPWESDRLPFTETLELPL